MSTFVPDASDQHEAVIDLASSFAEIALVVFDADTVQATLDQIVRIAVEQIDGCDVAGICVIEDDVIISVANTDEIVADLEAVQHAHFAGPCIDSITQRRIVYAEEIAVEQSWSAVAAEFVSAEVRGALCLPLVSTTSAASLNLYSRFPAAYSALDRARAVILASLAGVALSAARSHETDIQVSEDLHRALTTREVIGQAQGILMERERVSAHEAFDILRRASQHLNRKLRDIAQELVDTGERPITGDRVTERGPERGPDRARSVAHRARSDRETPTTP